MSALRRVHAHEAPGYLSRPVVAERHAEFGGTDGRDLVRSLKAHGASMEAAWIAALGEEQSLLAGRRWFSSEGDIRRSLGVAIDAGVRFGPGLVSGVDAFARETNWVGGAHLLVRRAQKLGLDLDALIAAELAARGAPGVGVEGLRGGYEERDRLLRATMRLADECLEPGIRMTVDALDAAVAGSVWAARGCEVQESFRRRGVAWGAAVREVLGWEQAVLRGRVATRDDVEWRRVVRWRRAWSESGRSLACALDGGAGGRLWLPGVKRFAEGVGGFERAAQIVFEEAGVDNPAARAGRLSLGDALAVLRVLSAEHPPGLMGERELRGFLSRRSDLPSPNAIREALRQGGITVSDAWRRALDPGEALRLRRVRPRDASELRLIVGGVLDAGVRVRPGWSLEWNEASAEELWIPPYRSALQRACQYGVCIRQIALELSAERGLPTRPMPAAGGPPRTSLRWSGRHSTRSVARSGSETHART